LNWAEKDAKRLLKMTVETWDDPPHFETTERKFAGGDFRLAVEPAGTEIQVKKWWWLNRGTSVRYATMLPKFRSKTDPRVFQSHAGTKGGVAFVSRRVPRPGIQARQWSNILSRVLAKRVNARIIKAVKEVFR
jgi:hypothetical protein